MKKPMSQKDRVLRHLKIKRLSALDALSLYGCYRLSSIIHLLRKDGHNIITKPTGEQKYATYKLVK